MARSHARHPGPTPPHGVDRIRPPHPRARTARLAVAVLVAACGGDSGVDPVQVRNLTLTVEPTSLVLVEGEDGRFHATLVDDAGRTVPTYDLSWRSSDPSVASVDDDGVVTGVEAGSTVVTASASGKKQDANVNVRGKGRLELRLASGSGQTGPVGEALPQPLVVKVEDPSGAAVSGIDVSWKAHGNDGSTSASSTTTNQNGLTQVVWTLGATLGSQTVQAQIKGSGSVEFRATATPGSPATVTVSPASASLEVGQRQQFTASAEDEFGNAVPDVSFTWSSTAGDVVTVEGTGMARALSAGEATVEASAGGASGRASVDVIGEVTTTPPGRVTDLSVRSASANTVSLGFTQVDDGTGSPADYEVRFAESPTEYRWDAAVPVSAGSCVAPVEGTAVGGDLVCSVQGLTESTSYDFQVVALNGTTQGEGSNVVTAVTSSGESVVATVTADAEAHTFSAVGESLQLTATALDSDGTPVPDVGFNWSSVDPLIASVDTEGLVVANAVGTTSIVVTALCCAAADTVAIEVTASAADAPGQVTDLGHVGDGVLSWTQVDDGTGGPAHYAIRRGCPTLSWGSAFPTEVSVSGTGIGETMRYETGQASGSCDYQLVSYRGTLDVDAVFGPLSNVTTVNVETAAPVATSIEVSPASFTLGVGQRQQLSATVRDQDGNVMSGVAVAWSSSASSVASVDAEGLVTASSSGSVRLEARLESSTSSNEPVGVSNATVEDGSTGPGTEFFSDGFETGDRSHTGGGFRWATSGGNVNVRHAGEMQDGAVPAAGDYALEFYYRGPTDNISAEQRFQLSEGHDELWIEYWIRVPSNYHHRDDPTGADNNKLFRLWGGDYGGEGRTKVGAEFFRKSNGDSSAGFMATRDGSAVIYYLKQFTDADNVDPAVADSGDGAFVRGTWTRFRYHVKLASGPGMSDGAIEAWIGTRKVIDQVGMSELYSDGGVNLFDTGYLFGAANSGWEENTYIYVDEMKMFASDPGW